MARMDYNMHRHQWTFFHSHFCKCDICGELKDMRSKFTMSDAALITLAVAAISVLVAVYSDAIVRFFYDF